MTGRRHVLSTAEIKKTSKELLQRARAEDSEQDDEAEDVLVRAGLSLQDAQKVMDHKYDFVLYYEDGNLFAIELTRQDHSKVAARIVDELMFQLPNRLDLEHGSGGEIQVSNTCKRQPDECFEPSPPRPGLNQPTVVVEVAVSQSLRSIYRSATQYLSGFTNVQVVIAVKMWERSIASAGPRRRMLFMMFMRNPFPTFGPSGMLVPDDSVSFGNLGILSSTCDVMVRWGVQLQNIRGFHLRSQDPVCSAIGPAPYLITIPANLVFYGDVQFVAPALNGLTLDLFQVQRTGLLWDK